MAIQEMRAKDLETGEASKVSIETPFGTIRGKYYIRAATQSVAFACLLAGYGAVHMYKSAMGSAAEEEDLTKRLLQEANATASPRAQSKKSASRVEFWSVPSFAPTASKFVLCAIENCGG